MTVVLCH